MENDITLLARETKLAPSDQKIPPTSQVARVPMVELLTVPQFSYLDFDGRQHPLPTKSGNVLLVNLWASWCRPCLTELSEFSQRYDEIRANEIEILALSVDGLGKDTSERTNAARRWDRVAKRKFPFIVGLATLQLTGGFQYLHDTQFPLHHLLPLPTVFLLNRRVG